MTDVLKPLETTTTEPATLDAILLDAQEHARPLFIEAVAFIEEQIASLPELPEDLFALPLGKWALMSILSLQEMPDWRTELAHDTTIDIALRLWGVHRGMRVLSEPERSRLLYGTEKGCPPKSFLEYYNL